MRGLVLGARLVTITGPGGVGKSSLAIEVARSLIDELTTVFVPIEDDREADPWRAIATSMGVRGGGGADLSQLVRQTLGDTRQLLLLDGCEHLLDRLAHVVRELLASSPAVHILVTSREPIAMTGERTFALGPLGHGEGSAASRLFLERSGLDATTLDAEAMRQVSFIGTRVSGLPLGVELAAARMRTLQLDEIATRLDDQPTLLRTKRGAVPHQQSLVATLDWSYDLLTPESQAAFIRLGAFPTGSLPREALARVLDSDAPEEALAPLLDASLVTRPDDARSAYSMLEPVRQYAAMRLAGAEGLAAARLRYAKWIVDLCSGVQVAGLEGDRWGATDTLRTHAPSIAATAAWAADNGHVEILLGIVAGAGRHWPRVAEPALLINPGLVAINATEAVDEMLRLRALAHLAFLHTPFRPEGARRLLARLEAEASGEMDLLTEHIVLGARVSVRYRLKRGQDADEATIRGWLAIDEQSLAAAVALGYPAEPHLYNRALNLSLLGDLDGEREALNRLIEWAGDSRPMWRGMALHVIAKRQHLEGDPASAVESAREAARLLVDGGDLDFGSEAEYKLAHIYADQAQYAQAVDALERANEYHSQIGLPPAIEEEPDIVARVAAGLGNWDEFLVAARCFLNEVPPVDEATARSRYLRGEPGETSRLARMIPAVARYLAAHARLTDAARVLGAMEMAVRESVSPQTYDKVGLLDRVQRLEADIGSPAVDAIPTSLEQLVSFMRAALPEQSKRR